MLSNALRLTPQQQAVVNHNYGPASVFAVAGAGKTTALVARIDRLVRERVFAPGRILAAAYNVAVREELGTRLLAHPGCERVVVMTLHALGLRATRMAWEAGLLPHIKPYAFAETERGQEVILNAALTQARHSKVSYGGELDNLDRADFLTWLGSCKGNLLYPDYAALPPILRQSGHAQPAAAPPQTPWYLPFAQLFEQAQHASGLLTFDDQLRLGWEVLVSHPPILAQLQRTYDCVMVDEFQDVNRAQYLMLDLITAPHRNYMVVGDDDQTIYEWRGANPRFILDFGKVYRAERYLMSENFRCKAGPLTLANAVIRHNRQREVKRLQLTQGLGGTTRIERSADRRQMGQAIVDTLRRLLAQGDRLQDVAVLVRARAQTPPVELALIQAQIPYAVVGSLPFYQRWEVTTLVAYCRLALLEAQGQRGKKLTPSEVASLMESWEEVYRHPKRYISQEDAQQIGAALAAGRVPLSQILQGVVTTNKVIANKPRLQPRLAELATLLQWLSGAFATGNEAKSWQGVGKLPSKLSGKSAHEVLIELEKKLGYCHYLEARGTISEAGVDEAENVKQFIEEAKGRGSLLDYLVYLKQLGEQQAAQQAAAQRNLLTIRTIHSAKGLEWPVVIIPSCDEGNIPHRKSENLEEERRLLYVALTRSRRDLYIYHLNREPSAFLLQAKWQLVLHAVALIHRALGKAPATWTMEELRAVAVAAPNLGLLSYFETWHPWQAGQLGALVQMAHAFFEQTQAAGLRQYAPAMDEWRKLATMPEVLAQLASGGGVEHAGNSVTVAGFDAWLTQASKGSKEIKASKPPAHNGQAVPASSAATSPRLAHAWQTFDVVHHPRHGQGIVISTTTNARGRELKIQFANGDLMHFRDDDPTLVRV